MTDPDEALRFLALLGKDPSATWFRTIRPGKRANSSRKGKDLQGFDAAALAADSAAGDNLYLVVANASKATGQAISDQDVESCPALFAEWDTGTTEEQLQIITRSGLPEPSILLHTGGKSLHAYWVLVEPIAAKRWKQLTAQLIALTGSDPQCSNPSRVMRLAGGTYYDKQTGKATGQARIISAGGHRYDAEAIIPACPPEQPTAESRSLLSSSPGRAAQPPAPF